MQKGMKKRNKVIENKLYELAEKGDVRAVLYWLEHNDPKYMKGADEKAYGDITIIDDLGLLPS